MSYLVVGLGNPGEEYEKTRHNIGFMVLDALGKSAKWAENSTGILLYAWVKLGTHKTELIQPLTFMNKSGRAVLLAKSKHKVKPENIIVVHDDVDLPFGSLKISFGRGSGGHRGVESVQGALKTKNFLRVRIGVAPTTPTGKLKKPSGERNVRDFLLSDFSKKEQESLKKIVNYAAESVETIVVDGKEKAMNKFN